MSILASQRCVKLLPQFVMTEVTDNRWSAYSSLMWEQRLVGGYPCTEQADTWHCFGGSFSRQWCKERTRRWIYRFSFWAVNRCKSRSRTGLVQMELQIIQTSLCHEDKLWRICVNCASTSGSFVMTFLPWCKTPGCVRMKTIPTVLPDRHSPQISFSHTPPPRPRTPPPTPCVHRWAVIISFPQIFNFLTSLNCNRRTIPLIPVD